MGSESKQRDAVFDVMKGIGILLVITCHFFGWNHPYLARGISSFHMPMFFIVAGYFSNSFTDWDAAKGKIKRYFLRLIVPYFFAQSLLVGWDVVMCLVGKTGWNLVVRDTLSLFWADVYGPVTPWGNLSFGILWFLCALFVAKTLLLVLVSRLKGWAIPVSFALAITAILVHRVFPYSIWSVSLGLTALPFVTIGWWLRNHSVPLWMQSLFIMGWLLAIWVSELDMYCFTWKCYPLDVIGALGGTFFLFLLSRLISNYMKAIGKAFAYLGMISLAVMCMHGFEIDAHLGNHLCALFGLDLPVWVMYVWRYLLTVVLAIGLVHIPGVKKLFV